MEHTTLDPVNGTLSEPAPKPRRLRRVFAIAATACAVGLGSVGVAPSGAGAASAQPNTSLPTWQVTIAGTASGNPFRLTGVLYIANRVTNVTQNGLNPYEVCLKVGFPGGSPQTGAIWFGSNSACFGSRAAIDTVYAAANGGDFRASPDSRLTSTYLNYWTARPGLAACPYSANRGLFHVVLSNSAVAGSINLAGYGGAFCGWSTYAATIRGVRIA